MVDEFGINVSGKKCKRQRAWEKCQEKSSASAHPEPPIVRTAVALTNWTIRENQDKPIIIRTVVSHNLLEARENASFAAAFGFAYHWWKKWRELFTPKAKKWKPIHAIFVPNLMQFYSFSTRSQNLKRS